MDKKFLVALVVTLIVIIFGTTVFFFDRSNYKDETSFNIPINQDYLIFLEGKKLYSIDPANENVDKLGKFDIEGSINNISISSDLRSIVLTSGTNIYKYTSFKNRELIAEHNEEIKNISIAPTGVILFSSGDLTQKNERVVYSIIEGTIRFFSNGRTPFFLDFGTKAAVGKEYGFRLFDFIARDSLDTERPFIPVASIGNKTLSGKTLTIIDLDERVSVYDILSSRPFDPVKNYSLVIPGVTGASANDNGLVALSSTVDGTTYISVYNSENRELIGTHLSVDEGSKILTWSR